ncbi:hypothetical protein JCM14469_00030 [Desulfatiferula olefinivorans]
MVTPRPLPCYPGAAWERLPHSSGRTRPKRRISNASVYVPPFDCLAPFVRFSERRRAEGVPTP